jgi:hypothetical protein
MNKDLENIGQKVLSKTSINPDEKFGSVIAILMVISIILTIIRVIQECNKNKLSTMSSAEDRYSFYQEQVKEYSFRKTMFTKMRIKKIIRKSMTKEQYNKYGLELLSSILDSGENIKDEEIITLVEASNV